MPTKILAFAGSARKDSYNKKLARLGAKLLEDAGAKVTLIDLLDYPLPIMNEDLEAKEGLPENAQALKKLMKDHPAFFIATPEYNSSISPLLKNVIDWASRREDGEAPLECYTNKVVALVSASPGALGGLRGLFHVRDIFLNINALVLPNTLAISKANEAFDAAGNLNDEKQHEKLAQIAKRLVQVASSLSP